MHDWSRERRFEHHQMCGDTFVYTYICTACTCAWKAGCARCVGASGARPSQAVYRRGYATTAVTAFPELWDTTSYHRDLPRHWICAKSSASRQAQVSPDQVRAVSGPEKSSLQGLAQRSPRKRGNGLHIFCARLLLSLPLLPEVGKEERRTPADGALQEPLLCSRSHLGRGV